MRHSIAQGLCIIFQLLGGRLPHCVGVIAIIAHLVWEARGLLQKSSKKMDYQVHNKGKQDTNHEAGHYGEEKLKVSFMPKYVAR